MWQPCGQWPDILTVCSSSSGKTVLSCYWMRRPQFTMFAWAVSELRLFVVTQSENMYIRKTFPKSWYCTSCRTYAWYAWVLPSCYCKFNTLCIHTTHYSIFIKCLHNDNFALRICTSCSIYLIASLEHEQHIAHSLRIMYIVFLHLYFFISWWFFSIYFQYSPIIVFMLSFFFFLRP